MNEAETRAELIDPALAKAGWGVKEGAVIRREFPITLGRIQGLGKRANPLSADYVLIYKNTKLAVVEAKGCISGLLTPPTGWAFIKWTWRRDKKGRWPLTQAPKNYGG